MLAITACAKGQIIAWHLRGMLDFTSVTQSCQFHTGYPRRKLKQGPSILHLFFSYMLLWRLPEDQRQKCVMYLCRMRRGERKRWLRPVLCPIHSPRQGLCFSWLFSMPAVFQFSWEMSALKDKTLFSDMSYLLLKDAVVFIFTVGTIRKL